MPNSASESKKYLGVYSSSLLSSRKNMSDGF